MVDVCDPAAEEALLRLPSLIAADGRGSLFVDLLIAMGERGRHASDGDGVVLHADGNEAPEDVGDERCRGNRHAKAVGPEAGAVGHDVFEEGRFEVPARGVESGGIRAKSVKAFLHGPDEWKRFDE